MLKAVIFDMDGVICDTEHGFVRSKQQLLQDLGIFVDDSYHYNFFGTTAEHTWKTAKSEFQLNEPVDELIRRADEIRHSMIAAEGLKPIPGVLDFIRRLHESGIKLAIASSSPLPDIRRTVETFQCQETFQAFASGSECENGKPAPDVFLLAARRLGTEPRDCLVIEDSTSGSIAAKAANMTCIGYSNPNFVKQDLSRTDLVVEYFEKLTVDQCRNLVA